MFDPPRRVAALLERFEPFWAVAGGWAIDLFLKTETRPHADIEIVVLRRDQLLLQNRLAGWVWRKAENGALNVWRDGEFVEPPVHEIHGSRWPGQNTELEVLLNESDGDTWIYRRNWGVTRPLAEIFFETPDGIKFLRPEIALLYKSKAPREKDERDFAAAAARFDEAARAWLAQALAACSPGHPWLDRL